jgi:hypothetical protein
MVGPYELIRRMCLQQMLTEHGCHAAFERLVRIRGDDAVNATNCPLALVTGPPASCIIGAFPQRICTCSELRGRTGAGEKQGAAGVNLEEQSPVDRERSVLERVAWSMQ